MFMDGRMDGQTEGQTEARLIDISPEPFGREVKKVTSKIIAVVVL